MEKARKTDSTHLRVTELVTNQSETAEFQRAASYLGFDYSREADRKIRRFNRFGFLTKGETDQQSYLKIAADYLISAQFYEFIKMITHVYSAEESAKIYLIRSGVSESSVTEKINRFKKSQRENLMEKVKAKMVQNKLGIRSEAEYECEECTKKLPTEKGLAAHRRMRHPMLIDEV